MLCVCALIRRDGFERYCIQDCYEADGGGCVKGNGRNGEEELI